ncbi:MAG TPA: helix-turn-helix domain-containing protein [Bryobacteraceae bacterium]|nr:helix-turn-helix domain-containing protein [Bryobacteraceae bacterium]
MASSKDAKRSLLRRQGVLHPHPEAVSAALFQDSSFFDPDDLVQVKYEMLRRVQAEQTPVSQAAHEAGLSRPSFYQSQAALKQSGLAGLIPQKPGPHGAHKLTAPVLDFLERQRASQPNLKYAELARLVKAQMGVTVHPRTVERVLSRRQKKRR